MTMTLVRVRGKRNASDTEKWHGGKRRKTVTEAVSPLSQQDGDASTQQRSARSKGQVTRPRNRKLSMLEQLPNEVIQAIFALSTNINLPLTSPLIASQLTSPHLYHSMTHAVLRPVLHGRCPTSDQLGAVRRLMNSRFFTYKFFQTWLGANETPDPTRTHGTAKYYAKCLFDDLSAHDALLLPQKLLKAPFTNDKGNLLCLLIAKRVSTMQDLEIAGSSIADLDPILVEEVTDGLAQAIANGAERFFRPMYRLGARLNTELLRRAVIDADLSIENLKELLSGTNKRTLTEIDWLDPSLWSWVEKAHAAGDSRGLWLQGILKWNARRAGTALDDSDSD